MRTSANEPSFRGRGICVRVLWGERLLEQRFISRAEDAALIADAVPGARGPLLRDPGDGLELRVPPGMTGALFDGQKWRDIGPRDGAVSLSGVTHAIVDSGPLTYELTERRAPGRVPPASVDASSYLPLNVGLAVAVLLGMFLLTAQQKAADAPLDALELSPATVRKLKVTLERARASAPVVPAVTTPQTVAPSGAKLRPGSSAPGPRPFPRATAHSGSRELTPSASAASILGSTGIRNLLSTSAAGVGELGAAVEGMKGVTSGIGPSVGGLGAGRGGGGSSRELVGVGIGGLQTRGRSSGDDGYGAKIGLRRAAPGGPYTFDESEPPTCEQDGRGPCGLDRELIRQVIASKRAQIRFCYEQALQRDPALAGKVTLRFVIAPSGVVAATSVAASDLREVSVGRCLVSRARTWAFPRPPGGTRVAVTYPFVFRPAGR